MAHFAELDNNNIVLRVVVINNNEILDDNLNESEELGIAFCKSLFGEATNWKQTSYNSKFRKHFAGKGSTYDASKDAFIPVKPFPSWVLNNTTCSWEAPVAFPSDADPTVMYGWNEENKAWEKM